MVTCGRNQITLVKERGTTERSRVFAHQGSVRPVVDEFVKSVRDRMQAWGIAGKGAYWKPVLQIEVREGAEPSYRELVALLEDIARLCPRIEAFYPYFRSISQ